MSSSIINNENSLKVKNQNLLMTFSNTNYVNETQKQIIMTILKEQAEREYENFMKEDYPAPHNEYYQWYDMYNNPIYMNRFYNRHNPEQFKIIPDYYRVIPEFPNYYIDKYSCVYKKNQGEDRELKHPKNSKGLYTVNLYKGKKRYTKTINELLLTTFLDTPEKQLWVMKKALDKNHIIEFLYQNIEEQKFYENSQIRNINNNIIEHQQEIVNI